MRDLLWVEKWRPRNLKDCILPVDLRSQLQDAISKGDIQNMIFHGGAGCGKTTVARAICEDLGFDHLFINASEDSGIDTLRSKIRNYASTVSLNDKLKVVILDEADYMNPTSFQPALRGAIEEFAKNCRFIFTCNHLNKILKPIHSRCAIYDFSIPKKEKANMAKEFFQRLRKILDKEGVQYDRKVVAEVLKKHFPDFRRTINECQRYSASGTIDSGILSAGLGETNLDVLVSSMKAKNFANVRKWVGENSDKDVTVVFRKLYDHLYDILAPSSIPSAILCIANYQYKSAFCADQEINLMACCIEIMAECEFR
jgi:DNA polymerase III delta prime subunit